jgi:predicted outer membrane repeat protein
MLHLLFCIMTLPTLLAAPLPAPVAAGQGGLSAQNPSCRLHITASSSARERGESLPVNVSIACSSGASLTVHINDLIVSGAAATAADQNSAYPGVYFKNCSWEDNRCLVSICEGSNVTFDDFQVLDVNRKSDLDAVVCFAGSSRTKIRGGMIRNNYVALAVLTVGNSSRAQFLGSNFTRNSIAGLYVLGDAHATLSGSIFKNNTRDSAIWAEERAQILVDSCTLANNSLEKGGSGACFHITNNAFVNISATNLSYNTAEGPAGAIWAGDTSMVDVRNTLFSHNTADRFGGGILGQGGSSISIRGSSFVENRVGTNEWGGGGHGAGVMVEGNVSLRVYDTEFLENHLGEGTDASGWDGGIYAVGDVIANISNCTFTGNEASKGGKGGGLHAKENAQVTITNSLFKQNYVRPYGSGAGVYSANHAKVFIDRCEFIAGAGVLADEQSLIIVKGSTFKNNEADPTGNGAGAAVVYSADMFIENSSFYNNTVGSRGLGGGAFGSSSRGNLTITGSIFTSNSAGDGGGGVAVENYRMNVTLESCVFEGNHARKGGGLFVSGSASQDDDGTAAKRPSIANYSISNSTFSSNRAVSAGGAAYLEGGFRCNISHSTFTLNR